jgi:hypothetical protein
VSRQPCGVPDSDTPRVGALYDPLSETGATPSFRSGLGRDGGLSTGCLQAFPLRVVEGRRGTASDLDSLAYGAQGISCEVAQDFVRTGNQFCQDEQTIEPPWASGLTRPVSLAYVFSSQEAYQ